MRRIGIELTDRCNLTCTHCLRTINHDRSNIDSELALATLRDAAAIGIEEIVFTGGEPTLHPDFIVLADEALSLGMQLTVVTNGQRPEPIWELYHQTESVERLTVALSLEGADEASFNLVRGRNAWRRFMQTVLGLQARQMNLRFSATIGPWNREQIAPILQLAHDLAVDSVSLAAYQPTMRDASLLPVEEYQELTAEMERMARRSRLPVTLSYEPITDRATHRCSTLGLEDLNINHRGEVTFCCQLSTLYRSPNPRGVVVGQLARMGLSGAISAQIRRVADFTEEKLRAWKNGAPVDTDRHPCSYCLRVFGQHAGNEELKYAA